MAALEQKFVPAANWGSTPFLGPQIVVIDETNRMGFWNGSGYAASAGGGAGLAISSGSDATAMAVDGSGNIASYTAGAKFVINRDGSGVPTSIDIDGGATGISSTLTRVGSTDFFVVSAGAKFVSGALALTIAQMRALEAAVIATSTTLERGFRVFVSDVGSFTAMSGGASVPGAFAFWTGFAFWWDGPGVVYKTMTIAAHSNSVALSAALAPLTVAANVMGAHGIALQRAFVRFRNAGDSGGTASAKDVGFYLNGTNWYRTGTMGGGALTNTTRLQHPRKSLHNRGVASQIASREVSSDAIDAGQTAAPFTASIDTSNTALVFDVRVQFVGSPPATPNTDDVAEVYEHEVIITNGYGLA